MASAGFGRASIIAAIEAIKQGKLVVVTDDESRENEGDFIMAGELATAETIGFMVRYSSGVICCSVRRRHVSPIRVISYVTLRCHLYRHTCIVYARWLANALMHCSCRLCT